MNVKEIFEFLLKYYTEAYNEAKNYEDKNSVYEFLKSKKLNSGVCLAFTSLFNSIDVNTKKKIFAIIESYLLPHSEFWFSIPARYKEKERNLFLINMRISRLKEIIKSL